MKTIYKVSTFSFRGIESATPIKETKATVYFEPCEATGYRSQIPKAQYESMPKSPQEAIDRERAQLLIKLGALNDQLAKLNALEDILKEAK